MHFNFLEQFKPKHGERYIIVESGEPKAVVLSYEDYQMIMGEDNGGVSIKETPISETSKTEMEQEFPFDMPGFLEETELIEKNMEEKIEPVNEPREAEVNESIEEVAQTEEKKREDVEDLKNELKRELTLDDLPF